MQFGMFSGVPNFIGATVSRQQTQTSSHAWMPHSALLLSYCSTVRHRSCIDTQINLLCAGNCAEACSQVEHTKHISTRRPVAKQMQESLQPENGCKLTFGASEHSRSGKMTSQCISVSSVAVAGAPLSSLTVLTRQGCTDIVVVAFRFW